MGVRIDGLEVEHLKQQNEVEIRLDDNSIDEGEVERIDLVEVDDDIDEGEVDEIDLETTMLKHDEVVDIFEE